MRKIFYVLCVVFGLTFFSPVAALACDDSDSDDSSTTPTEPISYSTAIVISEVFPNPSTEESEDEFIELYNTSTETVGLAGWLLSDATSNTYTLSGSIQGGGYVAFYRSDSNLAFNNTGDTAELYHPDGALTDSVEYTESADEDSSYALDSDGEWSWTTTPTPYRANVITNADAENGEEGNKQDDGDPEEEDAAEEEEGEEDDGGDEPTYQLSDHIILSELLPDPEGSDATDEWIELVNTGNTQVNLHAWEIFVGDDLYAFNDSTKIEGNGYVLLAITTSGLSLNNSGETVTLLDPTGSIMDTVTYMDAPNGESYSRTEDNWQWTTTPTPAAANVITLDEASEEEAEAIEEEEATGENKEHSGEENANENTVMSIVDAKALESGEEVIVQGIVSVLPEVFSTTYFYIQDDTAGTQIYSTNKEFPTLSVGDVVQISGTTSTSNGEERLVINSSDDMITISEDTTLTPLTVEETNSEYYGRLVTVTGTVTDVVGSTVQLDSGFEIYLKRGTGLNVSVFTVGKTVTATGIMVGTDDGAQVWPRSSDDIVDAAALAGEDETSAVTSIRGESSKSNGDGDTTYTLQQSDKSLVDLRTYWPWLVAGLVILSLLLRAAFLNTRLRSWCVARVRALVDRYDQCAASERNTTDSNDQNQYRGSHLWDRTHV